MATHHNYFLTTIAWQAIGIQLQKQDSSYKEIPQLHTQGTHLNAIKLLTTFKTLLFFRYTVNSKRSMHLLSDSKYVICCFEKNPAYHPNVVSMYFSLLCVKQRAKECACYNCLHEVKKKRVINWHSNMYLLDNGQWLLSHHSYHWKVKSNDMLLSYSKRTISGEGSWDPTLKHLLFQKIGNFLRQSLQYRSYFKYFPSSANFY